MPSQLLEGVVVVAASTCAGVKSCAPPRLPHIAHLEGCSKLLFVNNRNLESAQSYRTINHCYTTNQAALTPRPQIFQLHWFLTPLHSAVIRTAGRPTARHVLTSISLSTDTSRLFSSPCKTRTMHQVYRNLATSPLHFRRARPSAQWAGHPGPRDHLTRVEAAYYCQTSIARSKALSSPLRHLLRN